jgi:hypothetical protein
MKGKPTLKELWWDQRSGLLEMWATSQLPPETLMLLWHGGFVSPEVAKQALYEYNECFGTEYRLDQVNILINPVSRDI